MINLLNQCIFYVSEAFGIREFRMEDVLDVGRKLQRELQSGFGTANVRQLTEAVQMYNART